MAEATMSENILKGYEQEAIQKGLEIKARRENEDALVAIAEAYLASLEPPPPEGDTHSKKEPEKKPDHK